MPLSLKMTRLQEIVDALQLNLCLDTSQYNGLIIIRHKFKTARPSFQELVKVDVAVAMSRRHAALSCVRRFAVARQRFSGRRSVSTVLSHDCLGRPGLGLQSAGVSAMQACKENICRLTLC